MKPVFRPASAVRNGGRRETLLSISIAMRRSAIAPISAIAQRHRVGGQRHRLGVEVAAGDHRAVVGEHQRVVGHRVGLAQQHQRGMAQLVEAGAHHLRLAAQAVRVLHAVVAFEVRARGSRCRRAARGSTAPRRSGRAGRAARGCADRTGRRCRARRRPSARRSTSAASSTGSKASSACSASAVETCVPLISARPSLAASAQRRRCRPRAARQRPACAAPSTSISPSPISASVMCASGARSPEAPTEPWHGMHGTRPALCTASSVSITTGRTPEWPRARLAAFSTSIRRTTARRSGSPTPTLCERIRLRCSVARSSRADARRGQLAEAGVDAVDRRIAGGGALHHRGAGARSPARAAASSSSALAAARGWRCSSSSVELRRADVSAHQASEHRQVQALLARACDRDLVAGVGMAHDAGGRVVPQHALDALGRGVGAVADDDHARSAASSPCRRRRRGAG